MQIVDKIYFNNNDNYIKAYQNNELKWVKIVDKLFYASNDGQPITPELSGWNANITYIDNTYIGFDRVIDTIAPGAFKNKTTLQSIEIDDNIETIGASAFTSCSNITEIDLNQVSKIGAYSFYLCTGLTELIIPETVTSIGTSAFNTCRNLTKIIIKSKTPFPFMTGMFNNTNQCPIYVPCESVDTYKTYWPSYAARIQCYTPVQTDDEIWYTSTDGNIVEPYSPIAFGANIISNTYDDGKGVIKFDGIVTRIGDSAYNQCGSLASIEIPEGVTSFDYAAFQYCSNLTGITIPDGVTTIGNNAFIYCSSLVSIELPDSVTSIGRNAFYECSSLTAITIPDSVTSIGSSTFYNCSNLTGITIPNSVTSIGSNAFVNNTNMESITVNRVSPPNLESGAFDNTNNCPIYVPANAVNIYLGTPVWGGSYASRIQAIP